MKKRWFKRHHHEWHEANRQFVLGLATTGGEINGGWLGMSRHDFYELLYGVTIITYRCASCSRTTQDRLQGQVTA